MFFLLFGKSLFSQQLWHNKERTVRYQPQGNDIVIKYVNIRGFSSFGIDGGAATVLNLPLDDKKQLKDLVVKAIANDVVIGPMSLTLIK